ncbi:MAG: P-loop NTPase fold protein, partial [Mycobacteriales bacterium]
MIDELGLDSRDLYATTSKNRLTLPKEERKELFTTLLKSAAGIIALIMALAVFKAQWGSKDTFFWPTFTDLLPSSLPSVVFSATAIGLVVAFFGKQLTVKTDRSAPSTEEEFERVFEELLKEALGDDDGARLIVWIDELDRCNPGQVVSALETIRTFLEVKRCVFVVTADQKVLEKALDEAPRQATPADVTNPYYSTGGAYLDKIFQYQMTLPPVLSRSLTSFARTLIEDRPGAWTLIESKADVVSVLIPTHVRSPRRVKVLLNSFLSTYRLALRRAEEGKLDGDVRNRAAEIAKLVCLRVEFPIFAAELRADPSLFERVTAALIAERDFVEDPDSDQSEETGSEPEEPTLASPFTSGSAPADELLLTGKVDKQTLTLIRKTQTQQLNGYLSKTATVVG